MKQTMRICGWLICLLALGWPAAAVTPKGHLVLNGGGEKPAVVMEKFIALSGGPDALILIVPTASELRDTGAVYRRLFRKEYRCTNVVPLKLSHRKHAHDSANVALIRRAGGIFIAGGDQRRIIEILKNTPVGDALEQAYIRGACLGGTSAGTACMSPLMLTGEGDFTLIETGNVELWQGFGFFPNAILDQHFLARSRQNRLIAAVLEHPQYVGIGVDEATAVWLKPDRSFEVLGEGWVQVYDVDATRLTHGTTRNGRTRLGVVDMRVHLLLPGDRYDLVTRTVFRADQTPAEDGPPPFR